MVTSEYLSLEILISEEGPEGYHGNEERGVRGQLP